MASLDVSAWNIGALALAVAAGGCTSRALGEDGDGSGDLAEETGGDDATSLTGVSSVGTSASDSAEASDDSVSYSADGYTATYTSYDGYVDGYIGYCEYQGCGQGQLCEGVCNEIPEPPPCTMTGTALTQIPVDGLDGALALTFADVDGDGADELVGVYESELRAADQGGAVMSSARDPGAPATDLHTFMVRGLSDANSAIEPVAVLASSQMSWHDTGGSLSFGTGSAQTLPTSAPMGVVGGGYSLYASHGAFTWDVDGGGHLVSDAGWSAADGIDGFEVGAAATVPSIVAGNAIVAVAGVSSTKPSNVVTVGDLLTTSGYLERGDVRGGMAVGLDWDVGNYRVLVTDRTEDPLNFGGAWTAVHVGQAGSTWMQPRAWVPGQGTDAAMADLDGDGAREVILVTTEGVGALLGFSSQGGEIGCQAWVSQSGTHGLTVGDYDGDGDAELATIDFIGNVIIFDAE